MTYSGFYRNFSRAMFSVTVYRLGTIFNIKKNDLEGSQTSDAGEKKCGRSPKKKQQPAKSTANESQVGGSSAATSSDSPKPKRLYKQESYDRDVLELVKSRYFKEDMSKRIDYVLVTTTKICANFSNSREIHSFLRALVDVGVQFEIDFGQIYDNHFFIKAHVPESCVAYLATLYNTDLSCANINYSIESKPRFRFFETELQKYEESELMDRAAESVSGAKPTEATNAERAMLLHRLMMTTQYGKEAKMYGLESLRKRGLIVADYTLHEGTHEWTRKGPLSDRQLLAKFWARFGTMFKKQPLNLIEKYFGTELGMYFAWFEFYIKCLIPAAFVGILSFGLGYLNTYITEREFVTKEICESKLVMCPYCEHYSLCPFTPLKNECSYSRLGFLLDNHSSIFFSMFMSVWATVFMVMWTRRLNMLKLRWNVTNLHVEETVRQEFLMKATARRISRATGESEPYIPTFRHCSHFVLTNATVMFCALVIFSVALGVIVYQYKLKYMAHISKDHEVSRRATWTAAITGSMFIALSILVFTGIYEKVAYWLTQLECPRTQQTFDRAFIVKNCILNFSNNYAAITYLAFFKGKFFTYPGATHQWNFLGGITTDLCGPGGCLADVGIQLAIVLTIPSFFSCLVQLIRPYLALKMKRISNIYYGIKLAQWESDFYLGDTYKYYLFNEYRDLLIQYGYITCFVCALPLAPLFALIRNIFEVRIDAMKFLKYQKRQIACKTDGLGAYNDILHWITYASVFTNACVIAFSSNFIPRTIYRLHQHRSLKGYVNSSLSVFNTNDYDDPPGSNLTTDISICYYHGRRYPPDHPKKYNLTEDYFYQLIGQLAFVLVFEHVIVLIKVLLISISRDTPRYVREKLRMQEQVAREERMKSINDTYKRTFSQTFTKGVTLPKKQTP